MDQLIGLFGHYGPFDLSLRPDTNAKMALSAVPITGKKGLLAKYGSLVNPGLFSMTFSVPSMESSGPSTRVPRSVPEPER